jgi:hypothetical protein
VTGPRIGPYDEFEGNYKQKDRSLAQPYGEFVEYERDRAAIDIGLHLTEIADDSVREKFENVSRTVTNTRVSGFTYKFAVAMYRNHYRRVAGCVNSGGRAFGRRRDLWIGATWEARDSWSPIWASGAWG